MVAEELGFIQHPHEQPAQLRLVENGQEASIADAGLRQRGEPRSELGSMRSQPLHAGHELGQLAHIGGTQDDTGGKRKQTDQRSHLQPCRATVRCRQDVVEEAILFVPETAVRVVGIIHRGGDPQVLLEELGGHRLVRRVMACQLEGDLEHLERVEGHPRGAVGLFEVSAGGKRCAAIEHADVVQSEEPAAEDAVAVGILAVHPPRVVQRQLVEGLFEEAEVTLHRAIPARPRRRA